MAVKYNVERVAVNQLGQSLKSVWCMQCMGHRTEQHYLTSQLLAIYKIYKTISQSDQIYIMPYVASESEARVGGARRSIHADCKQCQIVPFLKFA